MSFYSKKSFYGKLNDEQKQVAKFGAQVVGCLFVGILVFRWIDVHVIHPEKHVAWQVEHDAQAAAPHDPDWGSVCASAIIYIEDHLKSPGSGSGFPDCQIVSVSSDKKIVLIRGSYTAVNSFNARVKETYAATLNRNDARDDHAWNVSAFTN
jgi:hypothetical protein